MSITNTTEKKSSEEEKILGVIIIDLRNCEKLMSKNFSKDLRSVTFNKLLKKDEKKKKKVSEKR